MEVPQPTDVTDDPNTEEDESALPTPTPLVRKDGFYTFLLAATDEGGGNTDTIMVVGYDTANQEMGVVSIPRDTLVDRKIPKINSVYASDGIDGLKDVVSDLIGIPIDHYVTVNLNGFQRLVNAVGGVDFYVPCDMNYDDPTADPPLSIHYSEGMTHLDGQEAMEVVRFRHNNDGSGYTDVGRSQTQQKLLIAVGKKGAGQSWKDHRVCGHLPEKRQDRPLRHRHHLAGHPGRQPGPGQRYLYCHPAR